MTLYFEPDTQTGTMKLRPKGLSQCPFTDTEIEEMAELLRRRYESLARGQSERVVRLKQYEFQVEVRREGNPRQPTLVLNMTWEPGLNGLSAVGDMVRLWPAAFFQELDSLTACARELNSIEQHAVHFVVAELKQKGREADALLAPTLLAGYLIMAEQISFDHDAARSSFYTLALRGLGRLLPEMPGSETLLSGQRLIDRQRPNPGDNQRPSGRLGHFFRRLLGFDGDSTSTGW